MDIKQVGLSENRWQELALWLRAHEMDIAIDLEDFGDLTGVFTEMFNNEPRKVIPEGEIWPLVP